MSMTRRHPFITLLLGYVLLSAPLRLPADNHCGEQGIWLQVLGSGGPEIDDGRASASYLVWRDGHARILLDAGGGSSLNFEHAGADFNDLQVILFSHFHVDHSAELPVYIMGGYFTGREHDLAMFGPSGNRLMPAMTDFITALFADGNGAFGYLSEYATPTEAADYHLRPVNVDATLRKPATVYQQDGIRMSTVGVHHGPVPALAWKIEIEGKSLIYTGDMNGEAGTLPALGNDIDLLLAHNAIPEDAGGVARNLHMPPSVIGQLAEQTGARQLLLSHFMQRTLGREAETLRYIRKHYGGPVRFARDGECFALADSVAE